MAVLVLMYHNTPSGEATSIYDVPLPKFRDQIEELRDAGIPFIRFGDVHDRDFLSNGLNVALTFDDGHISNLEALEFLSQKRIIPASFIVSEWAKHRSNYISLKQLSGLVDFCDLGSHGATHVDLTSLSDPKLRDELWSSRKCLEDAICRPVDIMALPGGRGDARVLRIARLSGYRLVGNSIPNVNRRPRISVNRACITCEQTSDLPLKLALAGRAWWFGRNVRRTFINSMRTVIGDRNYSVVSRFLKSHLRGI